MWEYVFQHVDGETVRLPKKVFDKAKAYEKSIATEKRRDTAEEAAARRLRRVAEGDQADAARDGDDADQAQISEPTDDDVATFLGRNV